jgi:hypothetical protein
MQKRGLYYELVIAQSEKEKEKEKEKQLDSDKEDELEEELVRKAARQTSRRMSIMLRRSSIVSAKSVASETSEAGNDAQTIDDTKKGSRSKMPLMLQVIRLNSPEWYHLVLGGMASLVVGALMPV